MVEEGEKEKKRKGLRLVSRKSSRKMLGKWKKLDDSEKCEKQDSLRDVAPLRRVLGETLEKAVEVDPSLDGVPVPAFFRHSIDYVESHGLSLEGIYRVSCPKTRLDELERKVNEGTSLNFVEAHEAAGLIKRFLRQLPERLLSSDFESAVKECTCDWRSACKCTTRDKIKKMLRLTKAPQFYVLGYMFLHIRNVIEMRSENKMGLQALGLLFQTVLDISRQLVCYLIVNTCASASEKALKEEHLFGDVTIVPYVPPRSPAEVEGWLCEDKPMIEEELNKQNNLLALLHRQATAITDAGGDAKCLDSRLWGVQTAITVLKRRLKAVAEPTPSSTSPSAGDSLCVEMFEEKQLMAVQSMLRQDIVDEKRRIAHLCWKLHLTNIDCSHGTSGNTTSPFSPSQKVKDEDSEEVWRERSELEEAARAALIAEIVRLRNDCANLRAKIEYNGQRQVPASTRF
uniref:Rho-GAP domain-containing protein n=1 Tax=Haemonchus contortus TaxID=6289 RepID=A0A7I4XTG3_HAECO